MLACSIFDVTEPSAAALLWTISSIVTTGAGAGGAGSAGGATSTSGSSFGSDVGAIGAEGSSTLAVSLDTGGCCSSEGAECKKLEEANRR